jgi:uncharacterized protein
MCTLLDERLVGPVAGLVAPDRFGPRHQVAEPMPHYSRDSFPRSLLSQSGAFPIGGVLIQGPGRRPPESPVRRQLSRPAGRWQDEAVDTQMVVTVGAGILLAVAAIGTVYPALPGSALAIVTLIAWAWIVGSPAAWTAAVIGSLIAVVGWSASAVLTGRKLKQQQIPKRSVLVAIVSAVVGMFLIPVVGLFVGFGAGLLLSELARRRDLRSALASSVETLKATGIGILVEFGMVCLAGSVWMIGAITHFATR